jgi:hypothetical protein
MSLNNIIKFTFLNLYVYTHLHEQENESEMKIFLGYFFSKKGGDEKNLVPSTFAEVVKNFLREKSRNQQSHKTSFWLYARGVMSVSLVTLFFII